MGDPTLMYDCSGFSGGYSDEVYGSVVGFYVRFVGGEFYW